MSEARKLAAIVIADIVSYSRLARAGEEGTLARLRALRSGLLDPKIAARRGRVVKRTGMGRSRFTRAWWTPRAAQEIQRAVEGRNGGVAEAGAFSCALASTSATWWRTWTATEGGS